MNPLDTDKLERTYTLIEKGPQTFVAALFALLFVCILGLFVRALTSHKNEIKEMLNAERERAIKQELVAYGFLELVKIGRIVVKPGKRNGEPITGVHNLPPTTGDE